MRPSQGFTLLELMIVMVIILLGFSAVGIQVFSGNDAVVMQASAKELRSALLQARSEALITNSEIGFEFNLKENSYRLSNQSLIHYLNKKITVDLTTAQNDINQLQGVASIRFFPDGSSSGGRIVLTLKNSQWQIDVNWLTGAVNMQMKQGNAT